MNLFLDDVRDPPRDGRDWHVARSVDEARRYCDILGHGPARISFDHDLGVEQGEDGHEFAKWLVEQDLDRPGFIPWNFEYSVHSSNPSGSANIDGLLKSYLNFRAA